MGKIYDKVMIDYQNNCVELSGAFFNFKCVGVNCKEILDDYRDLQENINGDAVEFLTDLIMEDNKIISGTILDYTEMSKLLENIPLSKNATIEETLRNIGNVFRVYRILDLETSEPGSKRVTGGEILSFVW